MIEKPDLSFFNGIERINILHELHDGRLFMFIGWYCGTNGNDLTQNNLLLKMIKKARLVQTDAMVFIRMVW